MNPKERRLDCLQINDRHFDVNKSYEAEEKLLDFVDQSIRTAQLEVLEKVRKKLALTTKDGMMYIYKFEWEELRKEIKGKEKN